MLPPRGTCAVTVYVLFLLRSGLVTTSSPADSMSLMANAARLPTTLGTRTLVLPVMGGGLFGVASAASVVLTGRQSPRAVLASVSGRWAGLRYALAMRRPRTQQ